MHLSRNLIFNDSAYVQTYVPQYYYSFVPRAKFNSTQSNMYMNLCMMYMHENACQFNMIKITLFDSLFKVMSIN